MSRSAPESVVSPVIAMGFGCFGRQHNKTGYCDVVLLSSRINLYTMCLTMSRNALYPVCDLNTYRCGCGGRRSEGGGECSVLLLWWLVVVVASVVVASNES